MSEQEKCWHCVQEPRVEGQILCEDCLDEATVLLAPFAFGHLTKIRDLEQRVADAEGKAALADEVLSGDRAGVTSDDQKLYCIFCEAENSGWYEPLEHNTDCPKVRYDALTSSHATGNEESQA